jgi:OCT family organic cation transporter-like MFS transporter 18
MFLCVVMIPMVMSGALLNTIASSTITKNVSEAETGTSLGLSMATHSIIRTVSPTIGGYMYSLMGYASFGLLGFFLNGAMGLYLLASDLQHLTPS